MNADKYKIGLFSTGLGLTGGCKRIYFLALELCKMGHEVDVIVAHHFYEREAKPYPCPVINNTEAEKKSYDFLMLMNPFSCTVEAFKKINAVRRGMYILHLFQPEKYTPAYQKWIDILRLEENFYVFGNNPSWREYYNVTGIKNSFDLVGGIQSCFKNPPLVKTKTKKFTVVCHASVTPWKGFDLIQQSLNRLRINDVNVAAFAYNSTKVNQLRWPTQIFLNVPYDDMPNIYNQGDLFISMEDKQAGWANTVLEAMMCSVPVVCTKWGSEVYAKHLKNAYIIEREPTILRDTIELFFHEKNMGKSLLLDDSERTDFYNRFNYTELTQKLLRIVFG